MEITHIQNISYYDEIAGVYDKMMNEQESNKIVRRKVAEKFLKIVPSGKVLDFGGGTGLDLEWLTTNHQVVFCEPSTSMRKRALAFSEKGLPNAVYFLTGPDTDFTNWGETPPFSPAADAILANFAVINCISDIHLFFQNMAGILKSGGPLIALVLRTRIRYAIKFYFDRKPLTYKIKFNNHQQTVFVHSIKAIRKAADPHFYFCAVESLADSDFLLMNLIRK